jgi:hypothetical protein
MRIMSFRRHSGMVAEARLLGGTGAIVVYEFEAGGQPYFVRFYERAPRVWRRGYWYKEDGYFRRNVEAIRRRLPGETDPMAVARLRAELEYFEANLGRYPEADLLGKSAAPLAVGREVAQATVDFLETHRDRCDVLEIHHMRKGSEDVAARLALSRRSLEPRLDPSEWRYRAVWSTSIVHRAGVDPDDYGIQVS